MNPRIVPLFDIDVIEMVRPYATLATIEEEHYEPDMETLMELYRAHNVLSRFSTSMC